MVATPQADPRRRKRTRPETPMLNGLENPIHLLFLFLIVLLVFGAKRLPEIGRGLGTGMRDFKDALTQPRCPTRRSSQPIDRRRPNRPRPPIDASAARTCPNDEAEQKRPPGRFAAEGVTRHRRRSGAPA